MVQIMGSMEDERNFLTITFMKTRFQNRICEHLDSMVLCMRDLFTLWIFLDDNAIMAWIEEET